MGLMDTISIDDLPCVIMTGVAGGRVLYGSVIWRKGVRLPAECVGRRSSARATLCSPWEDANRRPNTRYRAVTGYGRSMGGLNAVGGCATTCRLRSLQSPSYAALSA